MAIGQFNSGLRNGKTFRSLRPGLQFQSPLKHLNGWAVFLLSEVRNGDCSRDNRDSRALVHVRNGIKRVRLLELAVVPFVLREASVPIMYRA